MNNWENKKTNEEILQLNRAERLGQRGKSKYGLPMTIVVYRNAEDIDVDIDGTIVCHKSYSNFVKGNICKTRSDSQFLRKGETVYNSDGLKMTCIEYRLSTDIDIQFEDGTVLTHKDYYAFKRGKYKNPNYTKSKPIKVSKSKLTHKGESIIAKNGMKMTIIDYRSSKDLDVQFEDGTIVRNKRYQHFKNGEINNPNLTGNIFANTQKSSRVGEAVIVDGVEIKIVVYRNRKDIDVQLPNGTILAHRKYEKFKDGRIDISDYIKEIRLGETNTNNEGLNMTIVRFQNNSDIDVQFDDGTIISTYYKGFLDGTIKYPKERLGESLTNLNGLNMTITKYNSATDIEVTFEDGYKVNTDYKRFTELTLKHPYPYMLGKCQIEQRAYNYGSERNFFYVCKCCHHHDIGTIEEINSHICANKEDIVND